MKAITKLKDQARVHEQKENWELAIASYREILQLGESQGGEVELSLYNRIGDLYLRLGKSADAVEQYEEAADRYADAGLYNNAIALCNKALRHMPNRVELLRRLGRFCAVQGFQVDARRWFLEYAEKQSKAGKIEDALSALEEFASLTDDPEVRELLARQLAAHERTPDAVEQFERAYALYVRAGNDERAAAILEEARAIDPDVEFHADAFGEPGGFDGATYLPDEGPGAEDDLGVEHGAGFGAYTPPPVEAEPELAEEASDSSAYDPLRLAEPMPEEIDTFGMVSLDAPAPAPAAEEAAPAEFGDLTLPDPAAAGREAAEEDEPMALPLLDAEESQAADDAEDAAPLPLLDEPYEEEPAAEELPSLDFDGELSTTLPSEAAAEPDDAEAGDAFAGISLAADGVNGASSYGEPAADGLQTAVLPNLQEEMDRARAVLARGDREGALEVLDELRAAVAEAGRYEDALGVVLEMEQYAADDIRFKQFRVEYASLLEHDDELVAAYLDLADALKRRGAETKAQAVARRVLDLQPDNAQAQALLRGGSSRRRDYVDLSAFLTEAAEAPPEGTRFVVAEKAPSGDEERDFAEMLTQFKAKVAENVSVEDASSHYDLGLAFKEMGLIEEAIAEFQTALHGGEERLKVYEELGDCFVQKGQYNVAVKILARAVQLPRGSDHELLGVYYLLGRCYEELGQRAEAKEAYERVVSMDLQFRDVPDRLARF